MRHFDTSLRKKKKDSGEQARKILAIEFSIFLGEMTLFLAKWRIGEVTRRSDASVARWRLPIEIPPGYRMPKNSILKPLLVYYLTPSLQAVTFLSTAV